jgi:FtsH-binding integral membrane protein
VAANRQQGSYLTMFLTGFTGFVAGLVLWAGGETAAGALVTLAGAVVLAYSLVGFRKIKPLEFLD